MAIKARKINDLQGAAQLIKELQTALAQAVNGTVEAGKAVILDAAKSMVGLGAVLSSSPSLGIGYATGAGSSVTQITSRATGVAVTGMSGTITTDTTSLAAEASAAFVVTNPSIAIGDVVVVSQRSGQNGGGTAVEVKAVAAGSFTLMVTNNNVAAGTAETGAIIINFAIIKAVSA